MPLRVICGLLSAFTVPAVAQAQWTFTKVADTTSQFSSFSGSLPAINDSGAVAFRATLTSGGAVGIFVASGGSVSTVASSASTYTTSFNANVDVNASGTVVFAGGLAAGGTGVFKGNGATAATQVASSTNYSFFNRPSINDLGDVAFRATPAGGGSYGIYRVAADGTATAIANPSTAAAFSVSEAGLINNSGAVAFYGRDIGTNKNGIYVSSGGTVTTVSNTFSSYGTSVSMNNSGTVGFLGPASIGSATGVLKGSGGATTQIATNTAPFSNFTATSINDSGNVAFLANLTSGGGTGIYLNSGGTNTLVIKKGDSLGGSTVNSVSMGAAAMNAADSIAFTVTLANGTSGVYVASLTPVPEPAVVTPLAFGGLALVEFIRRRRRARATEAMRLI